MGYRTRNVLESIMIEYHTIICSFKKASLKNSLAHHSIRDMQTEKLVHRDSHTHSKPVKLQSRLIDAVTPKKGIILDPAAGSFSVMESALSIKRNFLGCDING